MDAKFQLGQVVKLNDGQVTGTVEMIWIARNDATQFSVVYWSNGERHQDWLKEHELVAF